MERLIKSIVSLAPITISLTARAQTQVEMADGMRAEGKIYVVVAIILIVLTGLVVYLVMLDRKVKRLENLLSDKHPPTK